MSNKRANSKHEPDKSNEDFYWVGNIFIQRGVRKLDMTVSLSKFTSELSSSFKSNYIDFINEHYYSVDSHFRYLSAINTALKKFPTESFSLHWVTTALGVKCFLQHKTAILNFFIFWKERYRSAICNESIMHLKNIRTPTAPRNVLSDNPEKSWLNSEEYNLTLHEIWKNLDDKRSDIQTSLIKILSMQYARRPVQFSQLKIGDIKLSTGSEGYQNSLIYFPGVKDLHAETGFRDSKFEIHPVAEHIVELLTIHIKQINIMYQSVLGFSLTQKQLDQMPLFCSRNWCKRAVDIITNQYKNDIKSNTEHRLFHLTPHKISKILCWKSSLGEFNFSEKEKNYSHIPQPPSSPRTGRTLVITATRLRHTRIRQLARKDVPKHILSHWLGHSTLKTLDAYYNDPAEEARKINDAISPILTPLAMSFTGRLIDTESELERNINKEHVNNLEFAKNGSLRNVGLCGKHSFCSTTSIPVPCYRCKYFEPLITAPHEEVLEALLKRQEAENEIITYGGQRNLLIPIDLSADISAVERCIKLCNTRKNTLKGEK